MSLNQLLKEIVEWKGSLFSDDVRSYVITDLDIEISGGIFEIMDIEGDITDYEERYWFNGKEVMYDEMLREVKRTYRKRHPRAARIKPPVQLNYLNTIDHTA